MRKGRDGAGRGGWGRGLRIQPSNISDFFGLFVLCGATEDCLAREVGMPGERGGEWGWGENAFGAVFVMYTEVVMVRISLNIYGPGPSAHVVLVLCFSGSVLPCFCVGLTLCCSGSMLSLFSVAEAQCCPVSVLA